MESLQGSGGEDPQTLRDQRPVRPGRNGHPKRRLECRKCGKTYRKRMAQFPVDGWVCNGCLRERDTADISWSIMSERWFHGLLYRQVEANGLKALGIGPLGFVCKKQKIEERMMGQYTEGGDRYDMLLEGGLASKEGRRLVAIEIKKYADEAAVTQALRYWTSIQAKAAREQARGWSEVMVFLIYVKMCPVAKAMAEQLASVGVPLRLRQISSEWKVVEG